MTKRVLVTGGAGYLGSVLVPTLLDEGYEVDVFDRFLFGREPLAAVQDHSRLRLIEGDVTSLGKHNGFLDGVDAVIHLAALSNDPSCDLKPELTQRVNFEGTAELARRAARAGVRRFLFASSCSVYGSNPSPLVDELSELHPVSLYAQKKADAEQALFSLPAPGMTITALRMATLYGLSPRMRFDLAINLMVMNAVTKRAIYVLGGGRQWRPFLHVADASQAFITALQAHPEVVDRAVFNAGADRHNFQIAELAQMVREALPQLDVQVTTVPDDADKRSYRVSFKKITEELHFQPRCDVYGEHRGDRPGHPERAPGRHQRHPLLHREAHRGPHRAPRPGRRRAGALGLPGLRPAPDRAGGGGGGAGLDALRLDDHRAQDQALRAAPVRVHRGEARHRRQLLHRRPPRGPGGARGRGRRRGDHHRDHLPGHGQRGDPPGGHPGAGGHRSHHPEHRPGGGGAGHHPPHQGHHPGAHGRTAGGHGRHLRDRPAPQRGGDRGRRARRRGRVPRGQDRQPPRIAGHLLQLLPHQEHDHHRGRGHPHQRRRLRRAVPPVQPARDQQGRLEALLQRRLPALGHPRGRLQVQHDRHPVRGGAAPAAQAGRLYPHPRAVRQPLPGGVRRPAGDRDPAPGGRACTTPGTSS